MKPGGFFRYQTGIRRGSGRGDLGFGRQKNMGWFLVTLLGGLGLVCFGFWYFPLHRADRPDLRTERLVYAQYPKGLAVFDLANGKESVPPISNSISLQLVRFDTDLANVVYVEPGEFRRLFFVSAKDPSPGLLIYEAQPGKRIEEIYLDSDGGVIFLEGDHKNGAIHHLKPPPHLLSALGETRGSRSHFASRQLVFAADLERLPFWLGREQTIVFTSPARTLPANGSRGGLWRLVAECSVRRTWLVQYQPSPRGLDRVNTETGKVTPIVADEEILPTRLNLSPDGKWVLGLVQKGGEDAERGPSPEMMAWRLRDGAAIEPWLEHGRRRSPTLGRALCTTEKHLRFRGTLR